MSVNQDDGNVEGPGIYFSGSILKKFIIHTLEENRLFLKNTEYYKGMIAFSLYGIEYQNWIGSFQERRGRFPNQQDIDSYGTTWNDYKIRQLDDRAGRVLLAIAKNINSKNLLRRIVSKTYSIIKISTFNIFIAAILIVIVVKFFDQN